MNPICLYTETLHPRLAYVLKFIKNFNPDINWISVNSIPEYQSFHGISINYSNRRIKDTELFIQNSSWLMASLQQYLNIPTRHTGDQFQIFPNDSDDSFDLFAAIFYAIARVEEYLPFEEDDHQRYPAHASMFYKFKVLETPIIDLWVIQFLKTLEYLFKVELNLTRSKPCWSIGIDIDQFYKYQDKSLFKTIGGLIKSFLRFDFGEIYERLQVILFNKKDPYDSYDEIKSLSIDKSQLFFFILSGGHSSFDKNHSLKLRNIQILIQDLKQFANIGLHPSYSSNSHKREIELEKDTLENELGFEIKISRQHFLKLRFPNTFRQLLESGIKKDYSLGYAEFPGFRAGTCRSYYWYDLENEKETDLLLTPLIAMDRSYLSYLKYTPEQSVAAIKKLFVSSMNAGGHFHLVWHNSSFDFNGEWKNWNHVLKTLVDCFNQNEN